MIAGKQEYWSGTAGLLKHLRSFGPPATAGIRRVKQVASAEDGVCGVSLRHMKDALKNLKVKANKIVVLKRGKIIQTGTHDELLAEGGTYKKLYELQFAEEEKQVVS